MHGPRAVFRIALPFVLTGLGVLAAPREARCARPAPPLEYQVKAAFLLNFTKFIQWPVTETTAPFEICIAGNDPFGSFLDQMLAGETYMGRRIVAQRVQGPVPDSCQVVFVDKSEAERRPLLARGARGVLTVGEAPGFLAAGGMIDFVVVNGRVRFDINQSAAAMAGLQLSSKLLSVARAVE